MSERAERARDNIKGTAPAHLNAQRAVLDLNGLDGVVLSHVVSVLVVLFDQGHQGNEGVDGLGLVGHR